MYVYDGTRSKRLVIVVDEHRQARADDIIRINRRDQQHKIATQLGIYSECALIISFKMSYRILYGHCRRHGA